MSKRWMMLTCILLLGSAGPSKAHPLDSPDIVYIDGLPCNSLCQSYMAWSRAASSKSAQSATAQPAKRPTNAMTRRASRLSGESSKPAARARPAKPAAVLRQLLFSHRQGREAVQAGARAVGSM